MECISEEETISSSQPRGKGGHEEAPHITENPLSPSSPQKALHGWMGDLLLGLRGDSSSTSPPPVPSPQLRRSARVTDDICMQRHQQTSSKPHKICHSFGKQLFSLVLANMKEKAGSSAKKGKHSITSGLTIGLVCPQSVDLSRDPIKKVFSRAADPNLFCLLYF